MDHSADTPTNRLAGEQSPYLLQHQHNPVDWYPWGEAAFEAARAEDKPVFLSVGYATCHWCHVMERESFEDAEVARRMNDVFVSVKVDREERPDVDAVYMTVCQLLTGQGGWPLTVLLTPDRRPFFAGTYLPKESRHGRIGMLDLIDRVEALWRTQRGDVAASAAHIVELLQRAEAAPGRAGDADLDEDVLEAAYGQLRQRYDAEEGGFGAAPKFPTPHTLQFLLRHWRRTGAEDALRMATHTLGRMRLGGLFDHLGYGFHRYSTDAQWRLPHFEKMLYDQALLTQAYTEAYLATGEATYAATAKAVIAYVLRDLAAPEGGFFSAEDADSEGREGAFYVWHLAEVEEVLGPADARLAADLFNLTEEGNFEDEATRRRTGENLLYLRQPLADLADARGADPEALRANVERLRARLFEHRAVRERPLLDDKILTDWNGLMVSALAQAAQAFGASAYAKAATAAAHFILDALRRPDGRLLHRYRAGTAGIDAHLDDYAFFVAGLLDLYETTFDLDLLEAALALNETMLRHFEDEEEGGFYLTADDGEALLVRTKPLYDGAQPSGNAVALSNLLRLSRMTGAVHLEEHADALLRWAAPQVRTMPSGFTALLMGAMRALGPSHEVVVAGEPDGEDTGSLLRALRDAYLPHKVVLLRPPGGCPAQERLATLAPFTQAQAMHDGRATAYLCHHYQCEAPMTDPERFADLLDTT